MSILSCRIFSFTKILKIERIVLFLFMRSIFIRVNCLNIATLFDSISVALLLLWKINAFCWFRFYHPNLIIMISRPTEEALICSLPPSILLFSISFCGFIFLALYSKFLDSAGSIDHYDRMAAFKISWPCGSSDYQDGILLLYQLSVDRSAGDSMALCWYCF